MKKKFRQLLHKVLVIDSMIGFVGVIIILSVALFVQLYMDEAPCPLCLLQRAALVNIGIALLMNFRYRNKASHWALAILSACAGSAVSLRQILLHINSPTGFGSAFFGLHMYTWSFIAFATTIVGSAIMLLIYPEWKSNGKSTEMERS